ncbi:MAG: hypothetical protein EXR99_05830 [Gemmataceae bacterium]|nr:hypothetical protein [Gemmataceae bacterium]
MGKAAARIGALFFIMILAGCGGGEALYDVTGIITHEGKPIPKGLIFFDPDPTAKTPGSQGFANIENGKYNTATAGKGRGIKGGKYLIRIGGFDGKEAPEAPFGKYLFPEHQLTQDLPAKNQTFDYDVKKGPKS